MEVGFIEDFDLLQLRPHIQQILYGFYNLIIIELRLFQESVGHDQGNLKGGVIGNEFDEQGNGRQIAFIGNLEKYVLIFIIPKEPVPVRMKPERLMQLKVKSNKRHGNLPLQGYMIILYESYATTSLLAGN